MKIMEKLFAIENCAFRVDDIISFKKSGRYGDYSISITVKILNEASEKLFNLSAEKVNYYFDKLCELFNGNESEQIKQLLTENESLKQQFTANQDKNKCKDCCYYYGSLCHRLEKGTGYTLAVMADNYCEGFKPRKITNFDRIKNMTVEEMAEWFYSPVPDDLVTETTDKSDYEAKNILIDWLNQTVASSNSPTDEL